MQKEMYSRQTKNVKEDPFVIRPRVPIQIQGPNVQWQNCHFPIPTHMHGFKIQKFDHARLSFKFWQLLKA